MADLRHAYYSVHIAPEQQKLLNPVFATLRQNGHVDSAYVDDSLLTSESFSSCLDNIKDTMALVEFIGYMIKKEKSVLIPTHRLNEVSW